MSGKGEILIHEGAHLVKMFSLYYMTSSLISGETGWQMGCCQVIKYLTTLSLIMLSFFFFFGSMRMEDECGVE